MTSEEFKKKMFSVALIGPDGTGKSTVGRKLLNTLPIPARYVYMGINMEASNFVLPSTFLMYKVKQARGKQKDMGGPPDPNKVPDIPTNPLRRIVREAKSGLRMINLIAEEWFRQLLAWYFQARGYVTIFDRHFYFDYYPYHIAPGRNRLTVGERIHGAVLRDLYPKPGLVIFLDAPADVLFARKPEGTVELLEQRRQQYLQARNTVERFVVVDATQPVDTVVQQICSHVMDFYILKNSSIRSVPRSRAE